MPQPLTIKNPKVPSPLKQIFISTITLGPVFGLYYFWHRHQDIHFTQGWLNLSAHGVMIAMPIIWAYMLGSPKMHFEQTEEEYLGTSSYFDTLPMDWWTMFMMWATPVFAAFETGHVFVREHLKHPEALSTSPSRAMAILAVTFIFAFFYVTILTGKSEPQTLVSKAGLRPTLIRFFEWEKIHHASKRDELYTIYHKVNPALPAVSFRLRDPNSRATLERYLAANQIPISNATSLQYTWIKIGVLLGFALNLGISFFLRFNSSISLLWILLISFGIGTSFTLSMERVRGIHKFGKYLPKVEPLTQEPF